MEIWAGDELLIDSVPPNNGQVAADTGTSGGISGTSWIDIFARGPITINGDTAAPFAVHANQTIQNGHGGLITVKSTQKTITAAGLALQASDSAAGGAGGTVTVQANKNVVMFILLGGAAFEARGSSTTVGHGGTVNVKSFNGLISAISTSLIDVTGHNIPDGMVNLEACTLPIQFPPGTTSAGATVNKNPASVCGGAPVLPSYVILPDCVCLKACPCVTDFNFVVGQPATVAINGNQLNFVTQVRLSGSGGAPPFSCEPTAGSPVPILTQDDATIMVDVSSLATPADYKIITISAGGSCCSAAKVHIP